MSHPDLDELTPAALGDPMPPELTDHLAGCPQCRREVASLRSTAQLVPLSNYGELSPVPAAAVFARIVAAVGNPADDVVPITSRPTPSSGSGSGRATGGPRREDGVRSEPPPRLPRWVLPLAALVVGAALGAASLAIARHNSDDVQANPGTGPVVSSSETTTQSGTPSGPVQVDGVTALTAVAGGPLAGSPTEWGRAQLVSAGSDRRVDVDAPKLPAGDDGYEVWLLGDAGRMIALGFLDDGVGTFTVPQGIDLRDYHTVDISAEPPDGNPAHSGVSVVRGWFS